MRLPTVAVLAADLKAKRKAQGATIRELAERLDVSRATISRVERGYAPTYEIARRLLPFIYADHVEVEAGHLLGAIRLDSGITEEDPC